MMTQDNGKPKRGWEAGGVLLPASLLVGIGVGILVGHLVAYVLIGLGVGLFLLGAAHAVFDR
jgi:predicted ABC-type sugar transport system permease subunit